MGGQTDFRSQKFSTGKSQEGFAFPASFPAIPANPLAVSAGAISLPPFSNQHLDVLRCSDGRGCHGAGILQAGVAACRMPLTGCNPKPVENSRRLTAGAGEYLLFECKWLCPTPFMHSSPSSINSPRFLVPGIQRESRVRASQILHRRADQRGDSKRREVAMPKPTLQQ
jgi:hypothetical protein